MKNSEYWQNRFVDLETASNKYGHQVFQQIEPVFDSALREIENQINIWYGRFAVNNKITMQEARKLLNSAELKEFQWDVNEYIKRGHANKKWMTELENVSARFHISRLEALKIRTQQAAEAAFGNELDALDSMAQKVFTENYYHSLFEIQKGFQIGWDIGKIDERKLKKIIMKPWAADGKNFSDRIWQSKNQLVSEIHNQLTRTCILGKGPDDAIKHISQKMQVSKNQAGRLVMTEQAYFHTVSQKEAFKELDVEEYEIVATLDLHTSAICQEMDGKHFPMKDYEAGVTAPPFHPWCRSVTCPFFDDEFSLGERAARDPDTGETYHVPSDMTYPEWYERFVNHTVDPTELPKNTQKNKFQRIETRVSAELKKIKVEYNEVKAHTKKMTDDEIISLVSGGDKTSGSCASVALAYSGQKQGWNVLDFRGGDSMNFFSSKINKVKMFKDLGLTTIVEDSAKSSLTNGKRILTHLEEGKEYYLSVGRHAAIVRNNGGTLQYLELQSDWADGNGWKPFENKWLNVKETLKYRFGCTSSTAYYSTAYATDISQLKGDDFRTILGYINTKTNDQLKGAGGSVK